MIPRFGRCDACAMLEVGLGCVLAFVSECRRVVGQEPLEVQDDHELVGAAADAGDVI